MKKTDWIDVIGKIDPAYVKEAEQWSKAAAGRQHLVHAGFQFCVAFHAVQHHGLSAPSDLRLARPADR